MQKRLALVTLLVVWAAAASSSRVIATAQPGGTPPSGTQDPANPPAATQPPAPPASGQDQQPPGQPIFRAGINFVRVDVIATDSKGNPILDLMPDDLTVTEDGKSQVI